MIGVVENQELEKRVQRTEKSPDILEMIGISKDFEGVQALREVNFSVSRGEIHALVGENGAGKSTLMKILSGVYPHGTYTGTVQYQGAPVTFSGTRDARESGIAIIHQELNLVSELTVAENLFLGREPHTLGWVDWRTMRDKTREMLERVGLAIPPDTPVANLSVGQRQMTEIAKALSQEVDLLILDEPTSALADPEIDRLFALLEQLRNHGVTSIYISHKLDEVFRVADRITVLRDGSVVGSWERDEITPRGVVSAMVGRDISDLFPYAPRELGAEVLEVEHLSVVDPRVPRPVLDDISFSLRAGEILGVAGLMGAGRTELASTLFGAPPGNVRGTIRIMGQPHPIRSPQAAIEAGIALLTEDRKQSGLFFNLSIAGNISLAALSRVAFGPFVGTRGEKDLAETYSSRLTVKSANLRNLVGTLSGGNQQKVLLARWLATEPKILILDEPTRGIDVGAKAEIYRLMIELAREGLAILMISSELLEVIGMSDRVMVIREGRVAGILPRSEATEESVMHLATGVSQHEVATGT